MLRLQGGHHLPVVLLVHTACTKREHACAQWEATERVCEVCTQSAAVKPGAPPYIACHDQIVPVLSVTLSVRAKQISLVSSSEHHRYRQVLQCIARRHYPYLPKLRCTAVAADTMRSPLGTYRTFGCCCVVLPNMHPHMPDTCHTVSSTQHSRSCQTAF